MRRLFRSRPTIDVEADESDPSDDLANAPEAEPVDGGDTRWVIEEDDVAAPPRPSYEFDPNVDVDESGADLTGGSSSAAFPGPERVLAERPAGEGLDDVGPEGDAIDQGLDDGAFEDGAFEDDGLEDGELGDEEGAKPASRSFATSLERVRAETSGEQRSAWAYLGLLGTMFGFLLVFGYACSDQRGSEVAGSDPVELVSGGQPSRLVFRVDQDVVVVEGSVPDDAARQQVIDEAQAAYGAENVVDELIVDEATTLDAGTVRYVGSAAFDDDRPGELRDAIDSLFGLENRGFEVGSVEEVLTAVNATVAVDGNRVTLGGVLPDDQSVADLLAVAGEVWPPADVDGSGLTVGGTTWTDGVIAMTGSTATTDQRVGQFTTLVSERIGTLIVVDTSALTLVDNRARLAEIQVTIDDLMAATPIQFGPDSPVIVAGSDAVLVDVAATLNEVPDIPFEVVGHTDNVGDEQENLVLSQDRAAAVVERLTELGVDPARMTSRGEGEANPVADNDTTEGKAANRRIEFVLVGTSESTEPSE